jgi:NAD(P)-dependent dehydrogenase (short-subunit alcohol dehydrogenase family)
MTRTRFADKVALVTGAASGIGRAVTLRLAEEGAQVLAVDINADGLAESGSLGAGRGGKVHTRVTDVTKPAECRAAVDDCLAEFGRLDVLGNVAGICRAEHFTDVTEAGYRQMMGVNVDGYLFLSQAAIPHLLESRGNIVNIASNAGLMGQAFFVVYCMSKGAVVQLTRALALEYIKSPLRVNAIAPGGVMTNLVATMDMPASVDPELINRFTGIRPMGKPEDIATLFAFLASDEASNIHGAIVSSDGGLLAG